MSATVLSAVAIIVIVTLFLVILLLVVKDAITPKGTIKIDINDGKKVLDVNPGNSLMATLANEKIFLPSACGGKANCGQCKVQVFEGGGEILPTEVGFFNRKQIKDGWRLGCQVKVKDNLKIKVAESALSVKKLGVRGDFQQERGHLHQGIRGQAPRRRAPRVQERRVHTDRHSGISPELQGHRSRAEYRKDWDRYGFFNLEGNNPEPTVGPTRWLRIPERRASSSSMCVSPPLLSTAACRRSRDPSSCP